MVEACQLHVYSCNHFLSLPSLPILSLLLLLLFLLGHHGPLGHTPHYCWLLCLCDQLNGSWAPCIMKRTERRLKEVTLLYYVQLTYSNSNIILIIRSNYDCATYISSFFKEYRPCRLLMIIVTTIIIVTATTIMSTIATAPPTMAAELIVSELPIST